MTHPNTLDQATAGLPEWLASAVKAWVIEQESRGHDFTSAAAAVKHALADLGRATTEG